MKQKLFLLWLMLLAGAAGLRAAEAYAYLSSDNKTLTFYYDNYRSSRTDGITFSTNTSGNYPEWYGVCHTEIEHVVFDPSFADARPTSCNSWFVMGNLKSITGMNYLNTSEVTQMKQMFLGCPLESIDVSHFNTSKVTNMAAMFTICKNLKNIDLSSFDTSNVTDGYDGFIMMFFGCSSLTSLDLRTFVFSSGVSTSMMFNDCSALQKLIIPSSANLINNDACYNVGTKESPCTLVYPSGFTPETTASGDGWFKWKNGYFKEYGPEPYAMFSSSNNTLTFYYDKNRYSRSAKTYDLNTSGPPEWNAIASSVNYVDFHYSFADARPVTCSSWFKDMNNLKSISNISRLNTSEVTSMFMMFYDCNSLQHIELRWFDTSKVTDMSYMFYDCYALTSLDVSKFNTENVTDMYCMFSDCSSLTSLNVSKFNTQNVTNMSYMFHGCSSLTSLDVSNLNTESVTDMSYMFHGCSSLTSLNLSKFTFNSGANTDSFLNNCSSLTKLLIPATASSWNANACTDVGTQTAPCALVYPSSFTPEKTSEGNGWYVWKNGYFKDGDPEPYAVLSSDKKKLTFYYDKSISTSSAFSSPDSNADTSCDCTKVE